MHIQTLACIFGKWDPEPTASESSKREEDSHLVERVVSIEAVVLHETKNSDLVLVLSVLGILHDVPRLGVRERGWGERERGEGERERGGVKGRGQRGRERGRGERGGEGERGRGREREGVKGRGQRGRGREGERERGREGGERGRGREGERERGRREKKC